MNKDLKIYSDGGARGNPGPAASAFVVIENGRVIFKASKYLGVSTNNVAEYSALILALYWLKKNQSKTINKIATFHLDSELIVKQLKGEYKIKNSKLKTLNNKIKKIEKNIELEIKYIYIPRAKNKIADHLVNKELDENT